jgi:hypothetical protein
MHCSREQLHAAAKDFHSNFLERNSPMFVPLDESLRNEIGAQVNKSNAINRDIFTKIREEIHILLQEYFFRVYCNSDMWKGSLHRLEHSDKLTGPLDRTSGSSKSVPSHLSLPVLGIPQINTSPEDSSSGSASTPSVANLNALTDPSPESSNRTLLSDSSSSVSQTHRKTLESTQSPNLSSTPNINNEKKSFTKHAKKWTWQPDELQEISRVIMNSDLNNANRKSTATNSLATSFPLSSTFLSPSVKPMYSSPMNENRRRTYSRTGSRSPAEESQSMSNSHFREEP